MSKKPAEKQEKHNSKETAPMSKDEQVGFHKGSLSTLAKERQEMARIMQIVEQLMQMHVAALKELGVDLEKESQLTGQQAPHKKPEKPIEDLL